MKEQKEPRPGKGIAAPITRLGYHISDDERLQSLLSKLDRVKSSGASKWTALCPAHDDRNPSLSVSQGRDGHTLIKCHAGCPAETVVAAIGLRLSDLMPVSLARPRALNRPNSRVWASPRSYAATLGGQLAGVWYYPTFAVVRVDGSEGKTFRPLHPVTGGWAVGDPPGKLPLYKLPELATPSRVFVCEGEKATDAARALGLPATTSAHGSKAANKSDWTVLAGRDVVVIPDHDEAGERYACDVAKILLELIPAASVRFVRLTELWPEIPVGGDVADYVSFRDSASDEDIRAGLEGLADKAPLLSIDSIGAQQKGVSTYEHQWAQPVLVRASDVKPERLSWLWPGRVPQGKLTLLAGDPSLGKSLITTDMAARVSIGMPWPDVRSLPMAAGSAILLSAEDDPADTIIPRLISADADLARVHLLQTVRRPDGRHGLFTLDDLPALHQAVETVGDVRLIVIDPVSAYCGSSDSHKNAEIRGLLAPLAQLSQEHRVAVVIVTHLTKSYGGKALYRAMGSLAFIAAARAAWIVVADPDDPARRFMLAVKSNLGPSIDGLAYRIRQSDAPELGNPPCVGWESEPVTVNPDSVLASEGKHDDKREARSLVAEWLQELLANGPVASDEVKNAANEAGHSWSTVRRAKDRIGIRVRRIGFGPDGKWSWELNEKPKAE